MSEELSKAAQDVLAERQRQIDVEGFTPEHDLEEHHYGDLTLAALSYLRAADRRRRRHEEKRIINYPPPEWPFALRWWKPKSQRRDLVRAAALLLAEIERLDNAASMEHA